MTGAAGDVLEAAAPHVSPEQAAAIAARQFGVHGSARPLASERDHNFRIAAGDGRAYVLKIAHPGEPAEIADFQVRALEHIAAADPGLPAPRVVPARTGEATATVALDGAPPRIARLLTFMEGTLLQDAAPDPALDRALGAFAARLGRALRGFFHPAAATDLLWDIRKIGAARPMFASIADPAKRSAVERAADAYRRIAPFLPALRAQVVHNDMSRSNVVIHAGDAARVSGVIDFGDMMHAPLVCDIAVGASYRWSPDEHPLAGAARFVAGYAAVQPLEEAELDVLFGLIKARLALVCAIVDWQVARFPDKRDYVSRWNAEITQSLLRLTDVPPAEAARILKDAR